MSKFTYQASVSGWKSCGHTHRSHAMAIQCLNRLRREFQALPYEQRRHLAGTTSRIERSEKI